MKEILNNEKIKEILEKREYYKKHPKEAIRIFAKREDNVSIIVQQAKPEKENEENKD